MSASDSKEGSMDVWQNNPKSQRIPHLEVGRGLVCHTTENKNNRLISPLSDPALAWHLVDMNQQSRLPVAADIEGNSAWLGILPSISKLCSGTVSHCRVQLWKGTSFGGGPRI